MGQMGQIQSEPEPEGITIIPKPESEKIKIFPKEKENQAQIETEFSEEDMFVLKEDSVLIMEEQTISPDDIGTADGECDFDASEVYNPYLTEQIEEEEIKNEYNSSWAEVMDDYKAQKEKEEKEEEYVVTDHIQL